MLLPTLSLPTFGIPGNIGLLLVAIAILVAIYGKMQRKSNSDFRGTEFTTIALVSFVLGVVLLGVELLLPLLASFSIPSLTSLDVTMAEILASIIAVTIPLAAYQVIQLTRVLHWSDVVVFFGLALLPASAILGVLGRLNGAAVTGITGILTAHALGIIDTD